MPQHFYVNGVYLGARPFPPTVRTFDGTLIQGSRVYFCPTCEEVWGRLRHDHPDAHCTVSTRPCLLHAEWERGWGGHLSSPFSWGDDLARFEPDWPPAAIAYEAEVCLAHATHHWNQT